MSIRLVGTALELPFKLVDGVMGTVMYSPETTVKPYKYPNRYWFDRSIEMERKMRDHEYRHRQTVRDLENKYQKEIGRLKRQRDLQR